MMGNSNGTALAGAVKTLQQLKRELAQRIHLIEQRRQVQIERSENRLTLYQMAMEPAIGIHLNSWAFYVHQSLENARLPPDERSSVYWFIALVGNLVWAATSLLDPTGSVKTIAMSFGGAALGSGVFEKILISPDPPKSAKELLETALGTLHHDLGEMYAQQTPAWAAELESEGPLTRLSSPHHITFFVWSKIFSKEIPYAKMEEIDRHYVRFNEISSRTQKNVEIILQEFDKQWKTYLQTKLHEVGALKLIEILAANKASDFNPDLSEQFKAIQGLMRMY